ncbi:MAG: peptidylprolyl isomerase [Patescibacteria group bacterium]
MNQTQKKIPYRVIVLIAASLALIFAFAYWIALSKESSIKNGLLSSLPLPLLLVENRPIYSDDFFSRTQAHKIIFGNDSANLAEAKTQILQRLLYEKQLEILASRQKARLGDWRDFASLPGAEIEKNQVLKSAVALEAKEDTFKFWFYSQAQLNQEAYKTANFVLDELKNGKDFQELAKIYSQDISSMQFGGDLGPVLAENLMFEFKEKLLQSKSGDALIIPSRLGLHIVQIYMKKIQGEGKDVLYLKQIFLKASDFVEWAKEETKDYKIINIINI